MNVLTTGLEAWHLWILLGLLLAIAELSGSGFVLLAMGVACLAGAAVAAFTEVGLAGQIVATVLTAAVLSPLFVGWYRAIHRSTSGPRDEGWERGRPATVERYAGRLGVRLDGDFYPARYGDGRELAEGARVEVERIEGITARVRPLTDNQH
jgi:membrane protein implicated in regulation of membrane protease activity